MDRFALFSFMVLTHFIPATLDQFNLPKIFPKTDDVVFETKWNLTLGCVGVEPVTWTIPDSVSKRRYIIQSVNISREDAVDPKYLFGALLTVLKVSVSDIGYYSCHGVTTDKDNPTRAKNIYVYVRDENQLYVPTEFTVKYSIHLNLTLRCLPTSPDVAVILMQYKNQTFHEVPLNSVQFNPHKGFSFKISKMENHNQDYKCMFRRNNKTQNISKQAYAEGFTNPYIDVPDKYILKYIGDNFTVNCSLIVTQDSAFRLEWAIPNKPAFHTIRVHVNNYYNAPMKNSKLLLSKLSVTNLTAEDEGKYKCFIAPDYKEDIFQIIHLTVTERNSSIRLPKINSETKNGLVNSNITQLIINSSEDLILHCRSQRNIAWSYPQDKSDLNKHISIKNSVISEHEMKVFHSTLFLQRSHYLNGGFYYCHETGAEKDNLYKSSNIFIFVRDEENLVLFPVTDSDEYITPSSFNFWLPCIPTSPDVNVAISELYFKKLEYDPKLGFKVNMTLMEEHKEVTCEFQRDDYYETKFIRVLLEDTQIDYELQPNIVAPINELIFTTENLVLTCTVVIYNMKNLSIIWQTPSLDDSRNRISNQFIPIQNGKVLISSLTVKNVRMQDNGTYKCCLNNTIYSSVYIRVKPIFDVIPFIETPLIILGENLTIHCNILIDHNVIFNLKWNNLNSKDSRIITERIEYIPQIEKVLGRITLIIKNVTLQDQKNYSCSVFDDKNNQNSISTPIVVHEPVKPVIYESNIKNSKMHLKLGDSIKIVCLAKGIPEPEIIWTKDKNVIKENDLRLKISQNKTTLTVDHALVTDSGIYTCNATNRYGSKSKSIKITVEKQIPMLGVFIVIIVIILILMAILTVVFTLKLHKMKVIFKFRKKLQMLQFHAGHIEKLNTEENVNDQSDLLPYDNKWEFPRNKIKLRETLGAGNFGLVMKANLIGVSNEGAHQIVAVKLIKKNFDFMEVNLFLSELKIMSYVGNHINVVKFIGACTENITNGEILIILEYCKFGNLRNYLLNNRYNFLDLMNREHKLINHAAVYINIPNTIINNACICDISTDIKDAPQYANIYKNFHHISTKDLVYWSFQVSQGMEYLSSRKILHGDLAARNILLSENNIVKICDFGLSKNLYKSNNYKKKKQAPLPIKWMAIESIRDGVFSTQSDIWSFGIMLWEFFSLARTPYSHLEVDSEFCKKLTSGYRMEQPQYASKEIYQIMLDCWHEKPSCRPSFTKIANALGDLMEDDIRNIYAGLNLHFNNMTT